MRQSLVPLVLAVTFLVSVLGAAPATGGGVGISVEGDSVGAPAAITTLPFHVYRVPQTRGPRARRDLEFLWSDTYHRLGRPLVPTGNTEENELDRAGRAMCEISRNPFGFDRTDIRLVHDFLNFRLPGRRTVYNPLPVQGAGFTVRAYLGPDSLQGQHLDVYVYSPRTSADTSSVYYDPVFLDSLPGDSPSGNIGRFPSGFAWCSEDSTTGFPEHCEQASGAPFPDNSIMLPGPPPGTVTGTDSTGWAQPDGVASFVGMHEFQHALNERPSGGTAMDELRSSAAEALAGEVPGRPRNDVPYTFSLLERLNYQAWRSFTSYLVYKFRGVDLTVDGIGDDLLYRWIAASDSTPSLESLAAQMDSSRCAECNQLGYFGGLAAGDRLELLMHNWRVAQYVNKPALAEGQYGFPPEFGFDPFRDVGNWQDLDGDSLDNAEAIPPEVFLGPADVDREVVFAGARNSAACVSCARAMALRVLGSEYWVIQARPGLEAGGRDLVVRVRNQGRMCAGWKLMASAIAYSARSDTLNRLWRHPEWAAAVVGPTGVRASEDTIPVELVIPGFGSAGGYAAAVVVISLQHAVGQSVSSQDVLPYTLTLALTPQGCAYAVAPLAADPGILARAPTWSADGAEIAYLRAPAGGRPRIHRRAVAGGPETPLVEPDLGEHQFRPDWSPRGDWIAFDQHAGNELCDIWAYAPAGNELRRLTFSDTTSEFAPAFSPNGQQVAYLRLAGGVTELRRVNLDATGDALLARLAANPIAPRWTPDGRWIYVMGGDTLYAVAAQGGAAVPRHVLPEVRFGAGFDLHPGDGPILFGQSRSVPDPCGVGPFVRDQVAYHDTLGRPTGRAIVQAVGAWTLGPRWAPDGMRVAYDAGPAVGGGDLDVLVARDGCNRPPRFAPEPRDSTLPASCAPFVLDLAATDPDGQAVSFAAAHLPPGATLDPETGRFTWPVPGPPGAVHYVTFRAQDTAGGVHRRVVRLTAPPDGGPPAAVADLVAGTGRTTAAASWTAPGDDGDSGTACEFDLRYAPWPIDEGNFATAPRAATPDPGPAGTDHCVEIGELSPCTWYTFALKTRDDAGQWSAISNVASAKTKCSGFSEVSCDAGGLFAQGDGGSGWRGENSLLEDADPGPVTDHYRMAGGLERDALGHYRVRLVGRGAVALDQVGLGFVDRDPGLRAWPAGGRALLGAEGPVLRVTNEAGEEVTAALDGSAARPYVGTPGEALRVELDAPGGGAEALAVEAAAGGRAGADSTGIVVEVPEKAGGWRAVARIRPRQRFATFVVDSLGSAAVRIRFRGEHPVRSLRRVSRAGLATPAPLSLAGARHSRLGDVLPLLGAAGTTAAPLLRGDLLTLRFAAADPEPGAVRDWFLTVRGAAPALAPESSERPAAGPVAPPTAFALHPNRPNPSSGATRIRFEMPRPAPVRLEVFDLGGRRLATLAEADYPAGDHTVDWDRRAADGRRLPPGVYLYRLQAGGFRADRKLVLLP